jgi:23S rRNA (adenine2503-C2)-methyltransferase
MINIFGFSLVQLQNVCFEEGFPKYTATQLADWMYKKRVTVFDEMTNVSKKVREIMSQRYIVAPSLSVSSMASTDGTVKYLFSVAGEHFVEAVFIPDGERATLCISTQVGCALGCKFCRTGDLGLGFNLTTGEILSQVLFIPEYETLTNIVIMGMGEPLLNPENLNNAIEILTSPKHVGMSKKRITLSTVGIIPALKEFLQVFPCELAISLHSPFSDERKALMPIENKYPIAEVLYLLRPYVVGSSRHVSFEYIVFAGLNHSARHADELARLLNGIPSKINLMSYHARGLDIDAACGTLALKKYSQLDFTTDGDELKSPPRQEMERFQDLLKAKGFMVTIRKSRGLDIDAACGTLALKKYSQLDFTKDSE